MQKLISAAAAAARPEDSSSSVSLNRASRSYVFSSPTFEGDSSPLESDFPVSRGQQTGVVAATAGHSEQKARHDTPGFSLSGLSRLTAKRTQPSTSQMPSHGRHFGDPSFPVSSTSQGSFDWLKTAGKSLADAATDSAKRRRRGDMFDETNVELTRRSSCRSDGSQTALIETCDEPDLPLTSRLRGDAATDDIDGGQRFAMDGTPTVEYSGNRDAGGQENEGVIC